MARTIRTKTYFISIIIVLCLCGFLLDSRRLLFDFTTTLSSAQQQQATTRMSKKYVAVKGNGGLNNYIMALSNGGHISKLVNRTLLIHPCVHNDHTRTRSFQKGWVFSNRLRQNVRCKSTVNFRQLYRVNEDVPYEIATESHPVWTYGKIKTCTGVRGMSRKQQERLLRECVSKNDNEDVILVDDVLYLGSSSVFDFSQQVYELVSSAFAHGNIDLSQSMVVHVRLGDFGNYCANNKRKDCYYTMAEMESKLVKIGKQWNVSNVIILSNSKLPADIMRRNRWINAKDILKEYSMVTGTELMKDENLQVALEMATGVLAKSFIGNVYSTLSGSIATLRERYHVDYKNTTTSLSFLMGARKDMSYVNLLELLMEG